VKTRWESLLAESHAEECWLTADVRARERAAQQQQQQQQHRTNGPGREQLGSDELPSSQRNAEVEKDVRSRRL
jgi:hypothetical protein